MALALRSAFPLKTEIRLAQAVSEFEAGLDTQQKAAFRNNRSTARMNPPALKDVMQVTADMDRQAHSKHKASRSFGPRFTNMLQSVQQYAALGDVVVGGSQNLVACGVWAAVRMMLQLSLGHLSYLERLSELFMEAGRQAPRHNAMALIYPKSKSLQNCLCEYYIVVVKVCQQIQTFSRKPILGRMMSALDDSELKRLHSDLQIWSSSISGQIEVLYNESLMNETKEASKTRGLLIKWSDSEIYRQHLQAKVRWLDACSTYDYQTTWKQTRKKGTSSLFSSSAEYRSWKHASTASTMLLSGKVGAGKSVTMANIVDDLNLDKDSVVIYFFCRYDLPESLKCRTMVGSLARQYLSQLSVGNRLFTEELPILDTFTMTKLMVASTNSNNKYLLVDGLDECRAEERRGLLQCLAELQNEPSWHLGFSARLSAEDLFRDDIKVTWHVPMPSRNPEIESFVNTELARRQNNGELVTSDTQLITDIREALLEGSDGMFLWVSLQLDAICSEASDHDIRKALKSLPRDLNETYARILKNSARLDHKSRHVRLFKFITAAFEPLNLGQIQDVLSVAVGDTSWDPSKRINDIMRVLRFCGSLIMVDEEEHTVRFIHHTSRSFCLGSLGRLSYGALPFTEIEAHQELGEATLTYLSYGVFDKQISTRVIPKIDGRQLPEHVAHEAIGSSRLARSLFKRKSEGPRNIGPVLAGLVLDHTPGDNSQDQHPFYPYAQRFWLLQSRHISRPDMRGLWYHCMRNSDALDVQISNFTPHLAGLLDTVQTEASAPEISGAIWALNYSHVFLFDHLMGSMTDHDLSFRPLMTRFVLFRRYFKALSIQPVEFISLNMVSEMTWRLLPIAIELGAHGAVHQIIQWVQGATDTAVLLKEKSIQRPFRSPNKSQGDRIRRAMLHLSRTVTMTWDVRMLRLLINGRLSSLEDNARMIEGLLRSQVPQEILVRVCFIVAQAGLHLTSGSLDVTYAICNHFTASSRLNNDSAAMALESLLSRASAIPDFLYSIFRRACLKGNLKLALASWPSKYSFITTKHGAKPLFQGDGFSLVLQTISRDRLDIAGELLDDDAFCNSLVPGPAISRAFLVKKWSLLNRLVFRCAEVNDLVHFCLSQELIHYCAFAGDCTGLDFLLKIGIDFDHMSRGPNLSRFNPLMVLAFQHSSWGRSHSFSELLIRESKLRKVPVRLTGSLPSNEEKLLDYLETGCTSAFILTSLLGSGEPIRLGRFVCILTAFIRKTVISHFPDDGDHGRSHAQSQKPMDPETCLEDLRELGRLLDEAFQYACVLEPEFTYCEIILPLQELVSTVELLHQPQALQWELPQDVCRFLAQATLMQIVDLLLRNMADHLESSSSSFQSIWDDFCVILSQGRIADIVFSLGNDFPSSKDFFNLLLGSKDTMEDQLRAFVLYLVEKGSLIAFPNGYRPLLNESIGSFTTLVGYSTPAEFLCGYFLKGF